MLSRLARQHNSASRAGRLLIVLSLPIRLGEGDLQKTTQFLPQKDNTTQLRPPRSRPPRSAVSTEGTDTMMGVAALIVDLAGWLGRKRQ